MLVGGKLVAIIDDTIVGAASAAAALETRKRAVAAKGLMLLSSALESAFGGAHPSPTSDGGDNVADIVAAIANDKRGVIDERRAAAQAATRDRVRAASAATQAAAASAAMPGELEDLGSGSAPFVDDNPLPDAAEVARLRAEVEQRKAEMTRSMMAARDAATAFSEQAKGVKAAGSVDEAAQLDRKADAERARMHALLGELATLETELAELERVRKTLHDLPRSSARPASGARRLDRAPARRPDRRRRRHPRDRLASRHRTSMTSSRRSSARCNRRSRRRSDARVARAVPSARGLRGASATGAPLRGRQAASLGAPGRSQTPCGPRARARCASARRERSPSPRSSPSASGWSERSPPPVLTGRSER
ncbi:MAG: hypothetical protein H6Q90_3138 [Deltaproteobacteria bacterium]|nr:hypothetical protein [Deltaproteobacteria bacterium]